jgi:thymidylate synthase (FAD)
MPESQIIVRLNPDVPPTGSDLAVVNAARRSFNKRSDWDYLDFAGSVLPSNYYSKGEIEKYNFKRKLKDSDKRLIEFLARGMTADDWESFVSNLRGDTNWPYRDSKEEFIEKLWQWRNTPTHESPFGHCFFSFEIKVPLFLARQLVKHKFLRWSEYSRRYITDDVEFYIHDYRQAPKNKKQGSGGPHEENKKWQLLSRESNQRSLDLYNQMIQDGVAPEQARGVLPADLMTAVTWSGSLDAFASMCRLRLGSDAQKEAQVVADGVYNYLEDYCPVSAKALVYGC